MDVLALSGVSEELSEQVERLVVVQVRDIGDAIGAEVKPDAAIVRVRRAIGCAADGVSARSSGASCVILRSKRAPR